MTISQELSVVPDEPVAGPRKSRKNNPEKTRENILQEAIVEFVQQGLSGARVDAIADRIHTSKRMIYYYFGSKEQLYVEVLEKLYGDIRNTENRLNLSELAPVDAIRRLVEFTFDHHDRNVDFVRIVSIENIHNAEYVKRSDAIKAMNNTVLDALGVTLRRGADEGVFRPGLDPLDVHLLMSSFCFYRVSNRHTLSEMFQIDLPNERIKQRHREMICESVLRYLQA
ncbi:MULTISPECIES: TetR/AcrR family transcriptional regulator [unclassified Pseudomonas]|jgi:AcrR family transcriptional regulator|uniref:TetR/AcrR family transcriptional regulator n=1 Tax=unclassified Pseudomonas TaxID=196821 RepID=UPI001390FE11|nr:MULTISPECIES: TetR/AcrR family transcriptional regulator [unclassified Pseudomonas]MBH1967462.1 TetR family transcriptional regulator [Pseudomonadales bacterium]KAI2673817.1 TetR family transcriptional regulator [Pseudomonas sp. TNT3]MBF4558801.1 TetR family transcriptional regulator [Pseudomonas sp. p50(2008)]MBH2033131.1 TetR family transcriptional regulator [Pseudomonadales bacterium]MBH2074937.1 TetR family transcriptional regulator [Pseudomonadales bacterium]